jgi:transcription elongation factor GreA
MHDTLITKEGLEKLQAELRELQTTGRAAIAERIRAAAAAESNAVESVEYRDAHEDQALLERRIALLEERLGAATVVETGGSNGALDVGERVTVRSVDTAEIHEYQLVGTLEAAPSEGRISVGSPVGLALLGRRVGETALVAAPRGRLRFEIVAIHEGDRVRARGSASHSLRA